MKVADFGIARAAGVTEGPDPDRAGDGHGDLLLARAGPGLRRRRPQRRLLARRGPLRDGRRARPPSRATTRSPSPTSTCSEDAVRAHRTPTGPCQPSLEAIILQAWPRTRPPGTRAPRPPRRPAALQPGGSGAGPRARRHRTDGRRHTAAQDRLHAGGPLRLPGRPKSPTPEPDRRLLSPSSSVMLAVLAGLLLLLGRQLGWSAARPSTLTVPCRRGGAWTSAAAQTELQGLGLQGHSPRSSRPTSRSPGNGDHHQPPPGTTVKGHRRSCWWSAAARAQVASSRCQGPADATAATPDPANAGFVVHDHAAELRHGGRRAGDQHQTPGRYPGGQGIDGRSWSCRRARTRSPSRTWPARTPTTAGHDLGNLGLKTRTGIRGLRPPSRRAGSPGPTRPPDTSVARGRP